MALRALTETIFGDVAGDAPRVLAMHGWGRDRTDFDAVLEGIDSISLDLPGFGASPEPPAAWGAAEYAAAVAPVLERFRTPPVIVSHSFGGRVAVALAAAGHQVTGLVLVGVPLLRRAPTGSPALAYRFIRWGHRVGLLSDDLMEAARRKYGSRDYRNAAGVMREVLVRAVNETYEDELAAIADRGVPVYLLWGGDDTAAEPWIVDAAAEILASTSVESHIERGVGHDLHLERPDLVRRAIERFV